jgi:hypothetical protein
VVARLTDTRDPRYITHDLDALVRQRLYQIAAGYEDVNDADRLRHDPTFPNATYFSNAPPARRRCQPWDPCPL